MKFTFFATLKATVQVSDNDFNLLFESSSKHYDFTVRSLSKVGGLLYGAKNRRTFSNGEDQEIELSLHQLDLLLKSLELNNSDHAVSIFKNLYGIVERLQEKQNEINLLFQS